MEPTKFQPRRARGILLSFICLTILGTMPILSNGRAPGMDALSFAFFLSVWQLLFALPLFVWELIYTAGGLFSPALEPSRRTRTFAILGVTGTMFGISTFVYVLAMEKAGAASAAIALQAYPVFAIAWEWLFLGRRKRRWELLFTATLIGSLFYLGTEGTWRVDGISLWIVLALAVPFLWSVAHVVLKEVLVSTPITPAQVCFFRVLVSTLLLGGVLVAVAGPDAILDDLTNPLFQLSSAAMGFAYYMELIAWFFAVRHIDVSLASSITIPWPALTMVLAILFLGDSIATYQVTAFAVVAISVYGLLIAGRTPK